MIYKKCVMTIDKNKATLDEDIYLYRLDKNIELYFTIVNNKYRFNKGDMNNIILITNASFFQVRLYKNAEIKYTFAIQPTDGGQAILTITDDLIDDPIEVGDYDFQISLLDEEKTSMISMPIVSKQLHVCEPLVSDDATMGKAILGLSKLATGEIKNAFDSEGNYIREIHKDGDILSASIINKFEEALDTNTKAIKAGTGGTSYDDTEIKNDIKTIKDNQVNLVEDETSMEGIKDNEYPTLTTTDKTLIGGINELNTQYKDIANEIGTEALNTTAQDLKGAINEAFQSASNGKTLIAQAITGKGVATSNTDTFQTMADNISNIEGKESISTPAYETINGQLYREILNEDFDTNLNKNIWCDKYFRTWTQDEYLAEANYTINNSILSLRIDSDSLPWNAANDGDLRISGIQTGEKTGLHKNSPQYRKISNFFGFIAQYGYFELRAKMVTPCATGGNHCAWWMIGTESKNTENYEIDIFENYSKTPTKVSTVGHSWNSGINAIPSIDYDTGVDLSADFHTYGFKWTPNSAEFYIDGVKYHSTNNLSISMPMITVLSFYERRLNNTGSSYGYADDSVPYPKSFDIDYLKVYKVATSQVNNLEITSINPIVIDTNTSKTLDSDTGIIKELPLYCYVNWNDGTTTEHWVKWIPSKADYQTKINNSITFDWEGYIPNLNKTIYATVDFKRIECTNITLNYSSLEFTTIDPQTLIATAEPSNTTDVISWSVDNNSIAKVVDGVVTPKSNGRCIITATCGNYSATCSITVNVEAFNTNITNQYTNVEYDKSKLVEKLSDNTYKIIDTTEWDVVYIAKTSSTEEGTYKLHVKVLDRQLIEGYVFELDSTWAATKGSFHKNDLDLINCDLNTEYISKPFTIYSSAADKDKIIYFQFSPKNTGSYITLTYWLTKES